MILMNCMYTLYLQETEVILIPESGEGIQLSISKVTSEKAKRHHIDLFAENRKEEVQRLLSIGASLKERNYEPGADYAVLNDPDGNPFCAVQK